jgi:hypothetical protein
MGLDVYKSHGLSTMLSPRWDRKSSHMYFCILNICQTANKFSSQVSQTPNFASMPDWLHRHILFHWWTALEWYHALINCHDTWCGVYFFQMAIQCIINYWPQCVKTFMDSFTSWRCICIVITMNVFCKLKMVLAIRLATAGTQMRGSLHQYCLSSSSMWIPIDICTVMNVCFYQGRGLPVTTDHSQCLYSQVVSRTPVLHTNLSGPE